MFVCSCDYKQLQIQIQMRDTSAHFCQPGGRTEDKSNGIYVGTIICSITFTFESYEPIRSVVNTNIHNPYHGACHSPVSFSVYPYATHTHVRVIVCWCPQLSWEYSVGSFTFPFPFSFSFLLSCVSSFSCVLKLPVASLSFYSFKFICQLKLLVFESCKIKLMNNFYNIFNYIYLY